MDAEDVQALVAAWQMGAISRDTLLHSFRAGRDSAAWRTNEQELELVRREPPPLSASLARSVEPGLSALQ